MVDFLIKPLQSMFQGDKPKRRKSGRYIASNGYVVERSGKGLWSCRVDGTTYYNSRLGDLRLQLADLGITLEGPIA